LIALKKLESRLGLLPDHDADFVLGCKVSIEDGFPLDQQAQARLQALVTVALQIEPDYEEAVNAERPLSLMDMLNQLAGVGSILTQTERRLVLDWANRIQAGEPLSINEMQMLFNLHAAKVV
jgi:hypothetical protein